MNLLDIRDLSVRYGSGEGALQAVDGFCLGVNQGEVVGLVGESGCGKSTVARAVLGFTPSQEGAVSGSVCLSDVDLLALPHKVLRRYRGSRIGYIGQNPFGLLNPVLTVRTQLRNYLRAHRRAWDACRPEELFARVGFSDPDSVLSAYPHQLSGGMAQRVVIAFAYMLNPSVVVADEPTTGLDLTVQGQVLDKMKELAEDESTALLIVTHDIGVVAQYTHRVYVMYAGRLVEAGPTERVLTDPVHPYTRALISAIPSRGRPLVLMPGSVPHIAPGYIGCSFHNRCAIGDDLCTTITPALLETDARQLACHHEAIRA